MIVKFNFSKMQWDGITVSQVQRWETLFPDVDVIREIKVNMPIWLEKMAKTKKAHKKNWTKFILNWLKRSQEKAVLS